VLTRVGVEVSKFCGVGAEVLKPQAGAESEKGNSAHFCRVPLCSCSKIFESGSGNFLNLRIRLLFRLRLQSSIQPQFTYVLL